MNESDDDNAANSGEPIQEINVSLRRSVFWSGIMALLYAVFSALGIVFSALEYYYYYSGSAQMRASVRTKGIQVTMAGIVEKVMMTFAFILLCRALFRYAGALKRAIEPVSAGDVESLKKKQVSCWQSALWVALLYTGWELTRGIAEAPWR